jgi:hypothetical protein
MDISIPEFGGGSISKSKMAVLILKALAMASTPVEVMDGFSDKSILSIVVLNFISFEIAMAPTSPIMFSSKVNVFLDQRP